MAPAAVMNGIFASKLDHASSGGGVPVATASAHWMAPCGIPDVVVRKLKFCDQDELDEQMELTSASAGDVFAENDGYYADGTTCPIGVVARAAVAESGICRPFRYVIFCVLPNIFPHRECPLFSVASTD